MNKGYQKYKPFTQVRLTDRKWPARTITQAPVWCSVDLRDGNQALVNPMNLDEKLIFFKKLCDMGFKEIEIGFPSANETEYEICRELIEKNLIPEDVTIQVLVQARAHLIHKTFEAIKGCKNAIVHFYNSTSALQRKVVFEKDFDGITQIAVEGARLIRELTEQNTDGCNIRFEYSPESFSGTEPEFAVRICDAVLTELHASAEHPVIINLPNTVELCTPNTFADQVEYFVTHLPKPARAIVSVHPHNDRGTGVAAGELALLAGAQRVEGTLFGNGERTGNLDIVTMGLNLYTQGVDPMLDFSNLPELREMFEKCTKMHINERHPYTGELVFTAFSGSHQDAINKGMQYMKKNGGDYWEIPYLPIDPADVGRQYEPIIRINSQSGKGGAAFVMQHVFGYTLPKAMHPEFGAAVTAKCDELGRELSAEEVKAVFDEEYINIPKKYRITNHGFSEESSEFDSKVKFTGTIEIDGVPSDIEGVGNGPINSFFNALAHIGITDYAFISYSEHAISAGSDSKAIAYINLKKPDGKPIFGVGIAGNINRASIKAILCAMNRTAAGK